MMDNVRGQDDIGIDETNEYGAIEAPPVIDAQERRMHVRAYNYWVSLLGNRALPSIEDLNPEDMEDFSTNSVLLDFSMGMENPAIIYLGAGLREECGIEGPIERADEVPPRSLLSRLTDHYLQIIANAAPVGFEAEFTNQRDTDIMYRGILMPFSSDDETIDFIYGVISWKEMAAKSMMDALGEEVQAALSASPKPSAEPSPIWADGPSATSDFEDEDDVDMSLSPAELAALEAGDFGFESLDEKGESETSSGTGLDEVALDDGLTSLDEFSASDEVTEADTIVDLADMDGVNSIGEAVDATENNSHKRSIDARADNELAFDISDELSFDDDDMGFSEAPTEEVSPNDATGAPEEAVLDELDLSAFLAADQDTMISDTLADFGAEEETGVSDDLLELSTEELLEVEEGDSSEHETAEQEPVDADALLDSFDIEALDIGELEALPEIEADAAPEAESEVAAEAEPEMEIDCGFDELTEAVELEAEPEKSISIEAESEASAGGISEDEMDVPKFTPLTDMPLPELDALPEDDMPAVAALTSIEPAAELPSITDVLDPAEQADGLAGALDIARQSAAQASDADARSRTALYRAIGHAHDFALATREAPADYAAMLEEAGITVQDRSPMTAIAKLVFGTDYDKTRLAEYALALDYAFNESLEKGTLAGQLGFYEGGLKGLVRDVRAARNAGEPPRGARSLERAYRKINKAQRLDAGALSFDEQGVTLIIARREHDGSMSFVACADTHDKAAQKILIAASKSI